MINTAPFCNILLLTLLLTGIFSGASAHPGMEISKPSRCYVVSSAGDTTWSETNTRKSCPEENREGNVLMDKKIFEDPLAYGTLTGHYIKIRKSQKNVPRHVSAYSAYATLRTEGRIRIYESKVSRYVWNKSGNIKTYDEQWTEELLVEKDQSKVYKTYSFVNLKPMMRENAGCMKLLNKYDKSKNKKLPFLIGGVALAWAGVITAVVAYLVHDKKLETDPDAKFPIAMPIGGGIALVGGGALAMSIIKYKKNEALLTQAIELYNRE